MQTDSGAAAAWVSWQLKVAKLGWLVMVSGIMVILLLVFLQITCNVLTSQFSSLSIYIYSFICCMFFF